MHYSEHDAHLHAYEDEVWGADEPDTDEPADDLDPPDSWWGSDETHDAAGRDENEVYDYWREERFDGSEDEED